MVVSRVVHHLPRPDNLRPIHHRATGSEDPDRAQEGQATQLPPGDHGCGIREAVAADLGPVEPIGADDAGGRLRLPHLDHLRQTLREEPIVGAQHLAVRAVWRDLLTRDVVIAVRVHEVDVVVYADSRILLRVLLGNLSGSIGTAVVDYHELPVLVGLSQHTLDALGEILLVVVQGNHDANQRRLGCHPDRLVSRIPAPLTGRLPSALSGMAFCSGLSHTSRQKGYSCCAQSRRNSPEASTPSRRMQEPFISSICPVASSMIRSTRCRTEYTCPQCLIISSSNQSPRLRPRVSSVAPISSRRRIRTRSPGSTPWATRALRARSP